MTETIQVGLVGYGFASQVFHVPLIQATPGLTLAAVASSDAAKVTEALPGVAVEADPEALFARPEIDLVVIPTPNETHYPLARAALEAGKHVVVDKPFTLDLTEARALEALAEAQGKGLSVFHNRRWDSDFLTLEALLAEGSLGRVTRVESRFDRFRPEVRDRWRESPRPGGGIWYDLGPHLLDQALVLFGRPRAILLDLASRRDGARVDDEFTALLDYEGLSVELKAGTLVAEETPRWRLHGTRGSYVKFGLDPQEERLKAGDSPSPGWGLDAPGRLCLAAEASEPVSREHPSLPGDYLAYYQGVAAALRGEGPMPVSVEEAIAVMALLEAGLASHRQRRWVSL
ncbi:oxidoreductase [Halomonas pacifica]|uniref:oxidoreductase n=1 Tax=Bisbaumannia pacifica TaxID=77098 RepID=UPI002358428D|nr:oxidoreductase [Halomonas pacifica]MDC8803622.1 oxidoreductase [Halomonas pacifica]